MLPHMFKSIWEAILSERDSIALQSYISSLKGTKLGSLQRALHQWWEIALSVLNRSEKECSRCISTNVQLKFKRSTEDGI